MLRSEYLEYITIKLTAIDLDQLIFAKYIILFHSLPSSTRIDLRLAIGSGCLLLGRTSPLGGRNLGGRRSGGRTVAGMTL